MKPFSIIFHKITWVLEAKEVKEMIKYPYFVDLSLLNIVPIWWKSLWSKIQISWQAFKGLTLLQNFHLILTVGFRFIVFEFVDKSLSIFLWNCQFWKKVPLSELLIILDHIILMQWPHVLLFVKNLFILKLLPRKSKFHEIFHWLTINLSPEFLLFKDCVQIF